jgi:aspartate aminotransferase
MFEHIPAGPPDVMYYLKKRADEDTSPEMVDVGVGIYRDEQGKYQELDVVRTVI